MSGSIEHLSFDSELSPAKDPFDRYRELYSAGADAIRTGSEFRAAMSAWRLDRAILFERTLMGVSHERGSRRVHRDDFDHFTLTLNVAGDFHIDDGSGFRAVQPGEIVMLDMSRPTRTLALNASILTMSMARDRVAAATSQLGSAHGRIIPARQGALLADNMASIARNGASLKLESLPSIGRVLSELLTLVLEDGPASSRQRSASLASRRADEIRFFIERHLHNEHLDIDTIAAGSGVSRATLYRHFARMGGIARYIRSRRLDAFRRALSDPDDARTLSQLAEDLGFTDEGGASRHFLDAFGMRPGAYRKMLRTCPPALASRMQLDGWAMELR